MTTNGSALLCYAMILLRYAKTDTGNKIKYNRIPKNTETQRESTKQNTKKTT